MANDVAVGFGGAGGYLEMNVYKPLIIANIAQSITLLTDGCTNFRKFLVDGTRPNLKVDTTVAYSDGSVTCSVARAGSFRGPALIVAVGTDVAKVQTRLRDVGIYIHGRLTAPTA